MRGRQNARSPDLDCDARCDDGKRFVVHAVEMLTVFVELEPTIRAAERPEDCGG